MEEQWKTLMQLGRDIEKISPPMFEESGHEIPDLSALLRWADRKVRLETGPPTASKTGVTWTVQGDIVFVPGLYRHYKGGLYRAISLVAHHETREPWVLYLSLKQGSMNVRPYFGAGGWSTTVDAQGLPGPTMQVPRFEYIRNSLDGFTEE